MSLEPNISLHIKNLDYDITKEEIEFLFDRFGKIEELNIIDKKGIAFIKLDKYEDAELAKKALDGISFLDRELRIDWA